MHTDVETITYDNDDTLAFFVYDIKQFRVLYLHHYEGVEDFTHPWYTAPNTFSTTTDEPAQPHSQFQTITTEELPQEQLDD